MGATAKVPSSNFSSSFNANEKGMYAFCKLEIPGSCSGFTKYPLSRQACTFLLKFSLADSMPGFNSCRSVASSRRSAAPFPSGTSARIVGSNKRRMWKPPPSSRLPSWKVTSWSRSLITVSSLFALNGSRHTWQPSHE